MIYPGTMVTEARFILWDYAVRGRGFFYRQHEKVQ
ncbi:hypothetical protein PAECIP111891_03689 [Paenibacillus allorhizoplanae]|uniref:Uncharacterized protein n=1 Tax=Paenibacillus allorhizoplanae TaxID=2905648 RepID=A0ABM9CF75_9BACL|nr:hypothetical protein PAECIP111891_03689 [Paenibacillus allorhizoplanae]